MTKGKKQYVVAWLLAVVVFNVVAFVIPDTLFEPDDGKFWVVYAVITIGFLGQLACSLYYMGKEKKAERFLFLPVIVLSYGTLVLSLVLGVLSIVLRFLPLWLMIILAVLVLAFYAFSVIQASAAAELVLETEQKAEQKTGCLYMLTAQAKALEQGVAAELKDVTRKVYESLRYSDPVSSNATAELDEAIRTEYGFFSTAVKEEKKAEAEVTAEKLFRMIKERNELCRLTKR